MFKNLESAKTQLSELAEIINKFKSEAVQLRLIEHLLNFEEDEPQDEPKATPRGKRTTSRQVSETKGDNSKPKRRTTRRTTSGSGPIATLTKLYDSGFFSKGRTIGDICSHAETDHARKIKPNEISGKLARMVRNGELKRKKNADNQYEYTKS